MTRDELLAEAKEEAKLLGESLTSWRNEVETLRADIRRLKGETDDGRP